MSDDGTNIIELTAPGQRDAKILALRLAGISVRKIAAEFRMNDAAVLESLDRSLPCLDAHTRARYLRESLAELDELKSWWHVRAKDSAAAAAIVLKIAERRACMLGLDAPAAQRVEIITSQSGDQTNSTQALIDQLQVIAAERPQPRLVHEAPEAPPEPSSPEGDPAV
jgi:hypothetical protein